MSVQKYSLVLIVVLLCAVAVGDDKIEVEGTPMDATSGFDWNFLAIVSRILLLPVFLLSASIALWQLREVHRTRQADLWSRVYERWADRQMGEALWSFRNLEFVTFEDFVERYGIDSKEWQCRREVMNYFEFVGALCERKLLPYRIVAGQFCELPGMYAGLRPFIEGYRRELGSPKYMKGFEWLYEQWKVEAEKEGWRVTAEKAWSFAKTIEPDEKAETNEVEKGDDEEQKSPQL